MSSWDDDDEETGDEGTAILTSPRVGDAAKENAFLLVLGGESTGAIFAVGNEIVIGRGDQANMRLTDAGISRLHARVFHRGGMIWAEDLGSTNGTRVNGELTEEAVPLKDGDKLAIGGAYLLKFSLQNELRDQFQQHLNRAATRDPLTGAYNRPAFEDQLEIELAYAVRHNSPASLLYLQLDEFAALTSRYGHLAGEYVLRELAGRLHELVRREDVVARCDGSAFGVACKGTSYPEAVTLAERIFADLRQRPFSFENRVVDVSCSIAVAWAPAPGVSDAPTLLRSATELLSASTPEGPSRLVVAPTHDDDPSVPA